MTAPIPRTCFAPAAVWQNVDLYIDEMHTHPERPTLLYHRGEFYRWVRTHWELTDRETLTSFVYQFFEGIDYLGANGTQPFNVSHVKAKAIVDALQNKLLLDRSIPVPAWVDALGEFTPDGWDAREMIACRNMLIHATSRATAAHTPRLMNHYSLSYDYDPYAPPPRLWMKFLQELWPDDPDSIMTLQEMFGYLLTYRTDLQTFFMMIGPPRCGKGTVVRVLTALLGGDHNVGSVSLADLNQRFGLEDIATKQLAVMQDTRFRSRDDGMAVERLLSITGEDPVSVEGKNKAIYTARLPVRFLLVSNEVPKMQDESGALRARALLLRFTNEIPAAKRDSDLTGKLLTELPGILNWALQGLDRLVGRRHFEQPKSAAGQLELLANLASPTKLFVEEFLRVDPLARVVKAEVFSVYQMWCGAMNIKAKDAVHFGRDLNAVISGLDDGRGQAGPDGRRAPVYKGIELNEAGRQMLGMTRFGS